MLSFLHIANAFQIRKADKKSEFGWFVHSLWMTKAKPIFISIFKKSIMLNLVRGQTLSEWGIITIKKEKEERKK